MKIKKLFIIVFALLAVFALGACENKDEETVYEVPTITENGEFYKNDDVSIDKELVYKMIKSYGSIDLMNEYIDSILFAEKISAIKTNAEGKYTELINSVKDNLIEEAGGVEEYNDAMKLAGNNSNDYLYLLVARKAVALEYVKDGVDDYFSDYYVTEDDLKAYYETYKYEEATGKAIVVNFFSLTDYINAIHNLGVVLYNSELKVLVGENAKTLNERHYSNENTKALSEYEGGEAKFFKDLYDSVYKEYRGEINIAGNSYDYDGYKDNASSIVKAILSMNEGEYTYMATSKTTSIASYYTVIYKTQGNATGSFDSVKAQVKESYISELVDSKLDSILKVIRKEAKLEFVDRDYQYLYDSSVDTSEFEGSTTNLFNITVDGQKLTKTADDLFEYVATRNINYYVLLASIYKYAVETSTYKLVYGDNKDIYSNAALRMITHSTAVNEALSDSEATEDLEKGFDLFKNGYSYSSVLDCLALGEMRQDLLYSIVIDELYEKEDRTYTVTENEVETQKTVTDIKVKEAYVSELQSIIDDLSSSYFYLDADKVLITFDFNGDYKADKLSDISDASVKAKYETALDALYSKLYNIAKDSIKTEDSVTTSSFEDDVKEFIENYNDALATDSTYGEYKKMGFVIKFISVSDDLKSVSTTARSLTDEAFNELQFLYTTSSSSEPYNFSGYKEIKESGTVQKIETPATAFIEDENGLNFFFTHFEGNSSANSNNENSKPSFKCETESLPYYNKTDVNTLDKVEVTMTTTQLAYFSYLTTFNSFLGSKSSAKDINVVDYPESVSNIVSAHYTPYTSIIADKYVSNENFVLYLLSTKLSKEATDDFAEYASIYLSSLNK